jgi:hypothetical protein
MNIESLWLLRIFLEEERVILRKNDNGIRVVINSSVKITVPFILPRVSPNFIQPFANVKAIPLLNNATVRSIVATNASAGKTTDGDCFTNMPNKATNHNTAATVPTIFNGCKLVISEECVNKGRNGSAAR